MLCLCTLKSLVLSYSTREESFGTGAVINKPSSTGAMQSKNKNSQWSRNIKKKKKKDKKTDGRRLERTAE